MPERDDFDPTHALDGWRIPAPAALDLELRSLQRARRTGHDEAKTAWLKARGYEMVDVEDIEAPDMKPSRVAVEAPAAAPPVAGNATAPVLDLRVAPPAASIDAPVLDMPPVTRRAEPDPRLLTQWQPLAWTAQARRISGASTEVSQVPGGLSVEDHAPQWLCALWSPAGVGAPRPGRWPDLAAVVEADTLADALQQLLGELPPDATVWPTEQDADWRLMAELVLHQDAGLRPAQARALRELAETERRASLKRLEEGYELQGRIARRRS